MAESQKLGDNVLAYVEGRKLHLVVDLEASGRTSASGKSTVIASTRGNAAGPEGVKVGLNVYRARFG